MTVTTLSTREFNQDTSRARQAASTGPVIITDRGRPAHVLLSIEEYRRITGSLDDTVDRLGLPLGIEDVEIEFPRSDERPRPADFS